MARLDDALGGPWWREHMREGVTDEAVGSIVEGFMKRLSCAASMDLFAIPVRRVQNTSPSTTWSSGPAALMACGTWPTAQPELPMFGGRSGCPGGAKSESGVRSSSSARSTADARCRRGRSSAEDSREHR